MYPPANYWTKQAYLQKGWPVGGLLPSIKTVTDTLHKEDKPQKVIAEEAGCYRVLYPSIFTES